MSNSIFPLYSQEEYPHAETTDFGATVLILKGGYLRKEVKNNSVVLISVFANSPT